MQTIFRLAWRDSRRNRARLLLFISSIIVGISALVAINSFSENLEKDINAQAKELLGADLIVSGLNPPTPSVSAVLDSFAQLSDEKTRMVGFLSMIYVPKNGGTRPAQIRAIEGKYPFYGALETQPAQAAQDFLRSNARRIVADKSLLVQFDLQNGDSIKIGDYTYQIIGAVTAAPGRAGIGSAIAPTIFMPLAALDSLTLLQRGSRTEYSFLFKSKKALQSNSAIKKLFEKEKYNIENADDRQRNTGEAFSQMTNFLNLVGFISLLLGCIGVASSVSIYVKGKLGTVAILRTLGASGRTAFLTFLTQIVGMGFVGALVGALLGSFIQKLLPIVLKDFLPVANVSSDISWAAMSKGLAIGVFTAVLFALLPLVQVRKVSPMRVLRTQTDDESNKKFDPIRTLILVLIAIFIFIFAFLQTKSIKTSIGFIIGVGVALGLLALTAWLFMQFLRRFFPTSWSFTLRQGIASLFRPNNQTLTLVVSIGLGTMLVSILMLTQQLLLNQVTFADANGQPNMILFDIQTSQRDSVKELLRKHNLPLVQAVPIITIRLNEVDGITRAMRLRDSTSDVPKFVYEREYRVTYRDTLTNTEQLLEGAMPTPSVRLPDGSIGVTLAERIAKDMKAKVGSKIVFDIQGALVTTTVTGIRKVDFNRVQTNFFVVFPSGFIEKAPQTHVVVTRVSAVAQSAAFQQQVVLAFPNISVVDLTQILKTVDEILGKISFVIRFMAMFSILTGFVVLLASMLLSRYQRIKESVLLRTLGASRRQILNINLVEYWLLGSISTLAGVLLALGATWVLARWVFKIGFSVNVVWVLLLPLSITVLVVLIGWFNSRSIAQKPPLEVLREEI